MASPGHSSFTPVSHPERCTTNTGRRGTSVGVCANAAQMQILLEDILCKQVSIYSGDMSHLLRYHGYSISSPLSAIRISQYFALALVQLSDGFAPWDAPSSMSWQEPEPAGIRKARLKCLYGQEASVQQKQTCNCCRLLDKLCSTFL